MGDIIKKFDISTYSASATYGKYDVVKVAVSSYFYYFVSTRDSNKGAINTTSYASNDSWKRFDDYNVDFSTVWTPSYPSSSTGEPRIINSTLDDGVMLLAADGINNALIKFNLEFENVSDKEAKSLLCFADFLGAARSFKWTPPPPYGKALVFQINSCTHQYQKHNVNNVSVEIERSFMIFGTGAGQQKVGTY